jgi:acyl-CoA thioester hydrolase
MTTTAQPVPTVDCGHTEPVTAYFDDLDSMGIVHNTRYPVMVERALGDFWARKGYTYAGGSYTHPDVCVAVAEFSIAYKTPIHGTGQVGVQLWGDRIGDSSVVYGFRVLSADRKTVHAEGRRVHIRLDLQTLRPVPWAPETRAIYDSLRPE